MSIGFGKAVCFLFFVNVSPGSNLVGLFFCFVLDTYRLDSWHACQVVLVPNTYLCSTLKFIMRYLVFKKTSKLNSS
jgi:hypothetical protein